jgi:hypothetical protein
LCSLAFAGERIYIELSPRRAASGFRRRSVSRSLLILCAAILFLCLAIFEIKIKAERPLGRSARRLFFEFGRRNKIAKSLIYFSFLPQSSSILSRNSLRTDSLRISARFFSRGRDKTRQALR